MVAEGKKASPTTGVDTYLLKVGRDNYQYLPGTSVGIYFLIWILFAYYSSPGSFIGAVLRTGCTRNHRGMAGSNVRLTGRQRGGGWTGR